MRVRVVANDVAARGRFFEKIWALSRMLPNHEKSCARLKAIQQIEQLRRNRGIRPVVKRERKLARRIRAANGGAKELRAGIDRSVGSDACSRGRSRDKGGRGDHPMVHWVHSRTLGCTSPIRTCQSRCFLRK